ncbi:hypothetical protein [Nocardioides sp. SYSU DS0651]|uniref:hypothetical protein n=1 Tax=Nocardioides sp. SYSU DS0651 TaxID=3415955 RepID=UPI003F4BEEF9
MSSRDQAGRRLSLITLDQVLSGASNVLVALLSAHLLGVAAFGYFGLVLIIYAAAQGVTRSLVGDPVLLHPEDARERPGAPIGAALIVGSVIGAAVAVVAGGLHLADLPLVPELLVLAVGLPGLVLHDLGRYLGFATQRPSYSLVLDGLWLLLIVVAMVALVALDETTLTWFILAWVGTGALASLLVLVQHGRPLRAGFGWLRERWYYSWRFLLSFSALQGAALVFSVAVAAVAGARALGAVRGVLLLIRPYVTFQTAAVAAGVSEIANAPGGRSPGRHLRRTTGIALTLALGNVALLLVIPDSVGRLILDETWDYTEPLLLPACLHIVCLGLVVGPRSYLTGLKAVRATVALDLATTVGILALGIAGVVVDGAVGAYWGTAIGQGLSAVVWWATLRVHASRRADEAGSPDPDGEPVTEAAPQG